jgi:hypothetical protein
MTEASMPHEADRTGRSPSGDGCGVTNRRAEFDPLAPYARVAQSVEATGLNPVKCRLESCREHQHREAGRLERSYTPR